ncbi:hypothetical protein AXG93_4009s1020 [Marchantia polymorpha subsp. ruderalis]|uniref:Uncharacterized protein n=1 Tax=Marchantia polymorpha subsp. ruderalis TaxID=1480154 RepID=A0A176W3R8_MARPO|nr:hypothetical protein AXG93_4009s1020 [Marchantia polymorpha subsp. ruderalis]
MEVPLERAAEVLTLSSDTEEYLVALEEVAAKAVEDVAAAESEPQKVASPRTSTEIVILETGEEPSAEEAQSLVLGTADVLCVQPDETNVAVAAEVAAKERKSQPTEARYQALQKRLAEEVEKRRQSEQVDELSVAALKKEQEYQMELAVRVKKLTEYEATRILDLELIEKLEA